MGGLLGDSIQKWSRRALDLWFGSLITRMMSVKMPVAQWRLARFAGAEADEFQKFAWGSLDARWVGTAKFR